MKKNNDLSKEKFEGKNHTQRSSFEKSFEDSKTSLSSSVQSGDFWIIFLLNVIKLNVNASLTDESWIDMGAMKDMYYLRRHAELELEFDC